MAIAGDFKGRRLGGRGEVAYGVVLLQKDPADCLVFWKEMRSLPESIYETIVWKIGSNDPARGRRVIETLMPRRRPLVTIYGALAEMQRDESAAHRLVEEGLHGIDRIMNEQPEGFESLTGEVLPVVERIEPELLPEFFWREVASRQRFDNPRSIGVYSPSYLIRYLAWYDREVAAALFEPSRLRIESADDRELASWGSEFEAWSCFDPRAAVDRLERVPVSRERSVSANAARIYVATLLGLPYEQRLKNIWPRRDRILAGPRRGF
jgi:hypothetical protein